MKNYKKLTKNVIIALTISFLFSNVSFAQKIEMGEYQMEILEVLHKKSIGTAFPHKGKKYVGFRVLLIPKTKKNKGFSLDKLVLKSGDVEYKLVLKRKIKDWSASGNHIGMRKPKETSIFAEVDKEFLSGTVYNDNIALFDIEVKTGSKIGTFKIRE